MRIALRYKAILCFIMASILFEASYIYVYADGINASEQRVIDEISGEYEVDGIAYKVNPVLITEVQNYLYTDIDLTDEQADKLIRYFYDNIFIGVSENYLIPIEQPDDNVHNNGEAPNNSALGETNSVVNDNQGSSSEDNSSSDKSPSNEETPLDEGISSDETGSDNENSQLGKETDSDELNSNELDSNESDNDGNKLSSNDGDNLLEEDISKITGVTDNYINDNIIDDIKNQIGNLDNTDDSSSTERAAEDTDSGLHIIYIILIGTGLVVLAGITILCRRFIIARKGKKKQMSHKKELHGRYIDMHAHILPSVDDGPKSMEEAIKILKLAHEQGIRTIIATPHYHVGRKTTPARLAEITSEVLIEAKKIDKDYNILLGNEIFYEEGCLEALKNNKVCTMAESRYVLVEFSLDVSYKQMYDGMRDFVMEGYSPIIAHAERYRCLYKKKERVCSLIKLGCYIQVNIDSFQNKLLRFNTPYIRELIAEGLVHFIATDCHNVDSRIPDMEKRLTSLYSYIDEEIIARLVVNNPSKIIAKKYI